MLKHLCLFLIFLQSCLGAFTLKEKILQGKNGDYAVFEQGGSYIVFMIRSMNSPYLILEEITVPRINQNITSWKTWVEQKAPGHTSWTSYLIDIENNKTVERYAFSKNAWLPCDQTDDFLMKLLTLPLMKTPESERKRIGPPPAEHEHDHRALWTPSVLMDNQTIKKNDITAWMGFWPKDNHPLAECKLELYFSTFPFPHWIEIQSLNYKISLRSIAGGCEMKSPKPLVFQKKLMLMGPPSWEHDDLVIHLQAPPYYRHIELFATDLSDQKQKTILLATVDNLDDNPLTIKMTQQLLAACLKKHHVYRIFAKSQEYPSIRTYAQTTFTF